jgi:hypothetical protein
MSRYWPAPDNKPSRFPPHVTWPLQLSPGPAAVPLFAVGALKLPVVIFLLVGCGMALAGAAPW